MKIKGTLKMFVVTTEDDGARIHNSMKGVEDDVKYLESVGANGISEIDEIDLILDSFEITEEN